jgi:Family of unknown function (DUF6352)
MKDFWISGGHHLLDRDTDGWLHLTDDFLKAYLARPELVPPDDAYAAERTLHASLLQAPRREVENREIAAISDPDARENWEVMLSFRDRLTAAPTLEAAYLSLVRGDLGRTPSLFLNQLTQVVLRNALDEVDDPIVLRAAELFFRPQKASVHEGALLFADAETIEMHEKERASSPLLGMFTGPAVAQLEILDEANAEHYFHRSDAFDMVLRFDQAARKGLAAALEIWLRHLLHIETVIEPFSQLDDTDWRWFVGLDAEATRIGNQLWQAHDVSRGDLDRVVGIFRLSFKEHEPVRQDIEGRPVWLLLALTADNQLRLKPQNLITGLPLTEAIS